MAIAYSPKQNKGRESVKHLCASDAKFVAPTTFPDCHTPLDYADSHAKVMSSIADLHIKSYDIAWAKDGHVLLRYSAEGTHCGEPHNGISATGNKASWTASAIFEVENGKIKSFTKEWDKLNMWKVRHLASDESATADRYAATWMDDGGRVSLMTLSCKLKAIYKSASCIHCAYSQTESIHSERQSIDCSCSP